MPADRVDLPKFFVLSYPRSRTKWLSEALGGLHDGFLGCRSVWDLKERLSHSHGNSDSSNILFLDDLRKAFPNGRFLIVHRDPDDVFASMVRCGLDPSCLDDLEYSMDRARSFGYPEIDYDAIDSSGPDIWLHCRGEGFNPSRWNNLCHQHIQVDIPSYLLQVEQEHDALDALCQTLKSTL